MNIIRILFLVVACLVIMHFNSCGTLIKQGEVLSIASDFEAITGREVRTTFFFADLGGAKIGMCVYGINNVYIDREFFKQASKIERTILIFHELGHCVCGSGHTGEAPDDSVCSTSIMASVMNPPWCYVGEWEKYIGDLRELCRK